MQSDHLDCDCLDCQPYGGNHIDSKETIIGKFVHSSKPINIYKSMGGAIRKTVQPGGFIGKVESLNSKKNWIILPEHVGGGYIPITKDLWFKTPVPIPPLTKDEKIDLVKGVIKNVPGGAVTLKAVDIAKGAGETIEGGMDTISFIGKNLKWFLIGIIILIVIIAYMKIK